MESTETMIRQLWDALYQTLNGFAPIPQEEIEGAARQLMIDHPDDFVIVAAGRVERLQWSKNHRAQVKADKVLAFLS